MITFAFWNQYRIYGFWARFPDVAGGPLSDGPLDDSFQLSLLSPVWCSALPWCPIFHLPQSPTPDGTAMAYSDAKNLALNKRTRGPDLPV